MKYIKYIVTLIFIIGIVGIIIKNTHTQQTVSQGNTPQAIIPQIDPAPSTLTPPRQICYIYNTEAGDSATLRMMFAGVGGSQVAGVFIYRKANTIVAAGPISGTAGKLDQKAMARTADLVWQTSQTTKEKLTVVFGDGMAYPKSDVTPKSLPLQQTDCGDSVIQK